MSLLLEKRAGVAWVTLNRPEVHNAINYEMRRALRDVWAEVEHDPDIRVAVVTGVGDKAFCAGVDLKETPPVPQTHFLRNELDRHMWAVTAPMSILTKPVIAAVNGYAYGGGMELALACDLRICSPNARFGLLEVRVGSMPGSGGTVRLLQAVPSAVAMKMLLTGGEVDAEEAYRVGLVSDLVPAGQLLARAEELAAQIARNAPLSIRATKLAAQHMPGMSQEQALLLERALFGLIASTADRQEGRRAFREGRAPAYTGQ